MNRADHMASAQETLTYLEEAVNRGDDLDSESVTNTLLSAIVHATLALTEAVQKLAPGDTEVKTCLRSSNCNLNDGHNGDCVLEYP